MNAISFMVLGVVLGLVVGSLPGLTATMGVSILVLLTYGLSMTASIMMLLGVYCSANYAGSISATLVNIPGTPSAVMTTLDAYPMALKGEAGRAIGIAEQLRPGGSPISTPPSREGSRGPSRER